MGKFFQKYGVIVLSIIGMALGAAGIVIGIRAHHESDTAHDPNAAVTDRKPLVVVNGKVQQLPAGDTLAFDNGTITGNLTVDTNTTLGNGFTDTTTVQGTLTLATSTHEICANENLVATSCGATPFVFGCDSYFQVTPGAGAGACTVTFSRTYATSTNCLVSARDGIAKPYTTSATAFTLTSAVPGTTYDVHCVGVTN